MKEVKLSAEAVKAIELIISNGNEAVVKIERGCVPVVVETVRHVKYKSNE